MCSSKDSSAGGGGGGSSKGGDIMVGGVQDGTATGIDVGFKARIMRFIFVGQFLSIGPARTSRFPYKIRRISLDIAWFGLID